MKRCTVFMLLLAAYLVFLIGTMPAHIASARIAAATQGTVDVIAPPQGTIWRGTAGMRIAGAALERVEWRFQAQRLFVGEWAYALRIDDAALRAEAVVARSFSQWRVHQLVAEGQASLVGRWLPLLGIVSPSGQIHINATRLNINEKNLEGQAQLQWRAAALGLSDVRPLGDYAAEVSLRGAGADYVVKTSSGVLRIAGRGTFQPPLQWSFNGEASAEKDMLPRLQEIFKLLGAVNTNNNTNDKGVYVINHR